MTKKQLTEFLRTKWQIKIVGPAIYQPTYEDIADALIREGYVEVEDLQTTIDNLAKVLGMESATLPHFNVSNYDETIPENLREKFYEDYPLLKKVYDLALKTYKLDGYEVPADGGPAIPPANSPIEVDHSGAAHFKQAHPMGAH